MVIAFILTGLHVADDFDIVIMLFLTDFVRMSISTDNVRGSKKPDTWNVTGFVKVTIGIGIIVVIESLVLLYLGMNYLGLSNSVPQIQTFVLCILMIYQMCNMLVSRERRHFWIQVSNDLKMPNDCTNLRKMIVPDRHRKNLVRNWQLSLLVQKDEVHHSKQTHLFFQICARMFHVVG